MSRAAVIAVTWLAALAMVAGEAHAGRAWGPSRIAKAGDGTVMSGDLQAAYTSRGELITLWHSPEVSVAVRPPGSRTFGPALGLGRPWGGVGEVATDQVGGAVIAWGSENSGVHVGERSAGGGWRLSRLAWTGAQSWSLAVGPAGQAAVAYSAGDGLYLAYRPAGGTFGAPVMLRRFADGLYPGLPDVAIAADGTALVVWQANTADQERVEGVQRLPSGALTPIARLSRPGWSAYGPRVAADGTGRAMAAWMEAPGPGSSPDPVVVAPIAPGRGFGAARVTQAEAISWLEIDPVERGGAFISFLAPSASGAWYPVPAILAADMASGATTGPAALGDGPVFGKQLATNARGDAALPIADGGPSLGVMRRPPGSLFGRRVGARCPGKDFWVQEAAMTPGGDLTVFFKGGGDTFNQIVEDRWAPKSTDCAPSVPAGKKRSRRAGRLALQARMPRGGKLVRGRWLVLRASCGTACRLRATGLVKVAGRSRRVPLTIGTGKRAKAGTATVRVGLTRARSRVVRQALRGRRVVRARIRLRASGARASRTLTFRVRVRR